jgi:hypothetical protein
MSDNELMNYLISFVNPAQSGPNPSVDLFSWGVRNGKSVGYIPGEAMRVYNSASGY